MNPSTTASMRPRGSSPRPPSNRNHSSRQRSGSWGVNESDEDIRNSYQVSVQNPTNQGSNNNNSSASTYELPGFETMPAEEKLRRRVAFFFMNPVEKFVARRQTPWKLLLQFVKIILVTTQLVIFGQYRYAHTNFYSDTQITFEHLFFKNWDTVREITAYPPSTGKYALYKRGTFYDIFNNAAETLRTLEDIAVSPLETNSTLGFCFQTMNIGSKEDKSTEIYGLNNFECIQIPNEDLANFSSKEYLAKHKMDVPWGTLHQMHLNFSAKTLTYQKLGYSIGPECFLFRVFIKFDNSDHDGQIPIELLLNPERVKCSEVNTEVSYDLRIMVLNYVVVILCALSLALCLRALLRAQSLRVETRNFFEANFQINLSFSEQMQFLNLW